MPNSSSAIALQSHNIDEYLEYRFLLGVKFKNQRTVWFLFVAGLLILGAYLRLEQFWLNRSLWLDEAFIASQIARGDWSSFFDLPMEYSHFVPPMFAVMGKLFVAIFGDNDLSLRIYPQLCSLLSLLLFYGLTRRLLTPWAVLISLFLFAIAPTLIFHASNLKQYSGDVMFTLVLLLALTYLPDNDQPDFDVSLLLFALLGVIVLWFSHPSLFILASIGSYLGGYYLYRKNWYTALKILLVGIVWIASFAVLYFVINGGDARESSPIAAWLFKFWNVYHTAFFPGLTQEGFLWIKDTFLLFFRTAGFRSPLFLIVLTVLGMLVLLIRQKQLLLLLVLPLFITLLASYMERYVFYGRLILFILPFAFIFIGIGVTQIASLSGLWQDTDKPYFNFCISLILLISLLLASVRFPLGKTIKIQEAKPALQYLQTHQQKQDKLYIYYWSDPAFHYYAPFYGFDYSSCGHIIAPETPKNDFKEVDFYWSQKTNLLIENIEETRCILGFSEGLKAAAPELKLLDGHGRVWLLFTHISERNRQEFLDYIAKFSTLLEQKTYPGSGLYLYDMGE
ncbi:MAG: hypothetical protein GQ583_07145 [Methyloprofundus sp.]|nr:hypothetical protein [Methyloprofundus sp.]